jgi:hypothetical protein
MRKGSTSSRRSGSSARKGHRDPESTRKGGTSERSSGDSAGSKRRTNSGMHRRASPEEDPGIGAAGGWVDRTASSGKRASGKQTEVTSFFHSRSTADDF